MKFRCRISKLVYEDVIVDAADESEAKDIALKAKCNYIDEEITDVEVEPVATADDAV